jgi:hypothetical protein
LRSSIWLIGFFGLLYFWFADFAGG